MIDLTKLDKPFGEYDIDTQCALFRAHREGGMIEWYDPDADEWCLEKTPTFGVCYTYRLKPEPLRDIDLPWPAIDCRFQYAARDDDGSIWVYEKIPTASHCNWSIPGNGHTEKAMALKHDPGNKLWNESLIKRPNGE